MDNYLAADAPEPSFLSYDESATYEEQVAALAVESTSKVANGGGLIERISKNRVYPFLPQPPVRIIRTQRKRDRDDDEESEGLDNGEGAYEANIRSNALLLSGSPIASMPTGRIFGYARYFGLEPVALEWIDDTSCILVFPSTTACNTAQQALHHKSQIECQSNVDDDYSLAKPIPQPIWPPEDRINQSLGVGEGLKGVLKMRVARKGDVKSRGAKNHSEFYRKHGEDAGKDPSNNALRTSPNWQDEDEKRRLLDAELDELQGSFGTELSDRIHTPDREDDYEVPVISRLRADAIDADVRSGARKRSRLEKPMTLSDRITSPPSRMRADYIGTTRLSLLERTSLVRASTDDLMYEGQGGREWDRSINTSVVEGGSGRRGKKHRGGRERGKKEEGRNGTVKVSKTSQELDDELEAFLLERD